MKKIVLIISSILLIAAVGIGIFIMTFDVNRYKDSLISQLETATGNKVAIGKLTLQWKGSVILSIDDFRIYNEDAGQKTDLLSFERASASVKIMPLLTGHIKLDSLSMERPNIHLIRMPDAKVAVRGYEQRSGNVSQAPDKSRTAAPSTFSFDIDVIKIQDGTVRFQDTLNEPGTDVTARKIYAEISNLSMEGPARFDMRMAVVSDRQNVVISGSAGGFALGEPFIRDLDIEVDLSTLNHAELLKAFPIAHKMEVGPGLAGILKAKVREMQVSSNKITKLSADLAFTGGRIELASLKAPIEHVDLLVLAEGTTVTVKSFSAALASGTLTGKGQITDIFAAPRTSLETTVEIQGLKAFIASVFAKKQGMDGNARLTFNGSMTGITWSEISKTLAGGGEFYLDRGVMMGTNVLNQTLGAITLVPGFTDMVRGYVPPQIQQSFSDSNTTIEPLRQSYTIESGYVLLPKVDLRTSTFDLSGTAKSSLTGDFSGNGMIRFAKSISAAMVQAVPEMKAIENAQGMIEIPMAFKGGSDNFKIIPDLKYVGTKVAVKKAGEVVADYLNKVTKDSQAAPSSGAAGQASNVKPPKLKDLMKSLLEEEKQ